MKKILTYLNIILGLLCAGVVQAHDHHEESSPHGHGAHVHGEGKASIAFEKEQGQWIFEAPSESIYGFEYKPKKEKERKAREDAFQLLEKQISKTFQFEESLGCQWSKIKIENEYESKDSDHSNVLAEFKVSCKESPIGKTLKINLKAGLPRLKKLKIDILLDDVQKSFSLDSSTEEILLKK